MPATRFVNVTTTRLDSPQEVNDHLAQAKAGWLQTTSGVWSATGSAVWRQVSGLDAEWLAHPALDGDFVLSTDHSAALRHCGDDWLWTEVREVADASHGRPVEAKEHRFVAIDGGELHYLVYWAEHLEGPPDGKDGVDCVVRVWRPWVSRFVGFDSGKR